MRDVAPRSRGIGHATGTATTTSAAVAIPATANAVKIVVTADTYVAIGSSSTAPDLSDANSVVATSNAIEVWDIVAGGSFDTHLYLEAVSGTADYTISFYG